MKYGYLRAKSRAVAVAAGTGLVVVPLTGAAAYALVSDEPTTPDAQVVADASLDLGDTIATIPSGVTAPTTATLTVDTPVIAVKENPPPPPVRSSSSSSSSSRSSRPVAQSSSVSAAVAGSAIIAEAAKYVGTPYRGGGTTPAGFDCSGFVSYVYGKFGYSLPHNSGAYYNVGTRVSSPRPGDIIVSPGHVGIYAGPNLQIDAPRPGKSIQFRPIWQSNPVYIRITG